MKSNPYQETLLMMRNQGAKYNPPNIQLGLVKSVSPIQITVGELPLGEKDLYISRLLVAYTESATTVDSDGDSTSSLNHLGLLRVGDTVFVYPVEDGQKYIVLGVV